MALLTSDNWTNVQPSYVGYKPVEFKTHREAIEYAFALKQHVMCYNKLTKKLYTMAGIMDKQSKV